MKKLQTFFNLFERIEKYPEQEYFKWKESDVFINTAGEKCKESVAVKLGQPDGVKEKVEK